MSTVIVTPTHIACDHTVVQTSAFNQCVVDVNHKKIFLDPSHQVVIGLCGTFDPTEIDHSETYAAFIYLAALFKDPKTNVTERHRVLAINAREDPKLARILKFVDPGSPQILITATDRYSFFLDDGRTVLGAKHLPEYYGIGTGGDYAAGLLCGGMSLNDIWKTLSRLDINTSEEYTSIPLDILVTQEAPDGGTA